MRILRQTAYFLIGFLLASYVTLSFAADTPATLGYYWDRGGVRTRIGGQTTTHANQVCAALYAGGLHQGGSTSTSGTTFYFTCGYWSGSTWVSGSLYGISQGYFCSDTSVTLQVQGYMCPATTTCTTTEQGSGWYSHPRGTPGISGQYCVNGCQITLAWDSSTPTAYETSTKIWMKYSGHGDGVACTAGNALPSSSANPPTVPTKEPPCAVGENVIGKSTGGVNCVPSTTPDSDTPKVKKEEKKETFPDGSEKTVTTTETCNGTNACSTTTTTNVTNNSAGQPGQAGTPGTTTGTGASKDGTATEENPDICAANPNLQICKGGMNEEGTQKKVLQELERFNNPGATNDSELQTKAATAIAESDAVKNQDSELGKYVSGEKTNEGIEGQKGAWASAMSSGWIDPIELGGCAPIVSNFADKVWVLDVCPTAAKISEIGAYAMWFLLAVGAFVMVTGGKQG